jgi:hypothetical protein
MEELIASLPAEPDEALVALSKILQPILDAKRKTVEWKLRSVYGGFKERIRPNLMDRREKDPRLRKARDLSGLDVIDTAPMEAD